MELGGRKNTGGREFKYLLLNIKNIYVQNPPF